LFDENATPTCIPGVDIEQLSETPTPDEFFLYSRIDGERTVGELCATSGLGRDATLESLRRLLELGLIDVPGAEVSTPNPVDDASESEEETDEVRPSPSPESSAGDRDSSEAEEETGASTGSQTGLDLSHLPVPPSDFDFDDDLLERDLPLEETKRRELLCLHDQLDAIDYYQFFGVEPDASAREIKHAYFKLSKRYHPDRYFEKDLGPFADIVETVFQHITRGHRILSDPEKRDAYDAQLDEPEPEPHDEEEPTPMNQPSSFKMARKEPTGTRQEPIGGETSDPDKREAAFRVLVQRGEKAREKGQIVKAAEQFRKALRIQRDLELAIEGGEMLFEADLRLEQAKLFAQAALQIEGDHPEAHLLMARIFEALDQREHALEHYEHVLEMRDDEDARRERNALLDS
jgi:tetratricopeptide (TPR) repeat protein